jgi:hypothetical protein
MLDLGNMLNGMIGILAIIGLGTLIVGISKFLAYITG